MTAGDLRRSLARLGAVIPRVFLLSSLEFRVSYSRGRMPSSAKSRFPNPEEPGPEELLVKVASRNAEALASLYDRFAPNLMGILVRILTSKADAESALETVFLRLWKEAPELARTQGSLAVWLVLMTRQVGLECLRAGRAGAAAWRTARGRQGRKSAEAVKDRRTDSTTGRRKSGEKSPAGREPHGRFSLAPAHAWLPRPDDIAWAEAHRDLLQKAFDQMPKPQRRALELAVFAAYDEAEIAAQLGEPQGKVGAGLRAAFTFLRHRQHAVLGTWTADI